MRVILLESRKNFGALGEMVDVKPGFARNFLIPQGKALPATEKNVAFFESKRAELEAKAQASIDQARGRADTLSGLTIKLEARASDEGKLFGSIGTGEISDALKAQHNVDVERKEISLPEGPFHFVGENEVSIQLHSDVIAQISLVITAVEA